MLTTEHSNSFWNQILRNWKIVLLRLRGGSLSVGTVDGQIKLGQKSLKSKFTNLHRLITALSQIG
jgi:hypothetical protein